MHYTLRELLMPSFFEYTTSFETLWEWISSAPSQQRHPMRAPTVITTANNIPNARTMILRDVLPNTLIFFTDKRSPKIQDILTNPHTTIHSYDAKKKLQIRIRAQTSVVNAHPQWNKWRSMGLNRFQDYGSSLPPGSIIQDNHNPNATLETARENFCILQANITDIELLKLSRAGHERIEWKNQDGSWQSVHLVP
ncbi:MAG: hypothetical protein CL916_00820 [Deltaproteobacteria bacterium]|nr:hypothetical protein [Deltaproteobacteria bacterium]